MAWMLIIIILLAYLYGRSEGRNTVKFLRQNPPIKRTGGGSANKRSGWVSCGPNEYYDKNRGVCVKKNRR